jgi:hypothetical protein
LIAAAEALGFPIRHGPKPCRISMKRLRKNQISHRTNGPLFSSFSTDRLSISPSTQTRIDEGDDDPAPSTGGTGLAHQQ